MPHHRFLSLWLPCFATDLAIREQPALAGLPLVLTEARRGRLVLAALSSEAAAEGLFEGMPLADARAMMPQLRIQDSQPAAQARALARLADWADRYSPSVALDARDGLMLDITGCAHLFAGQGDNGETAMVEDLATRLGSFHSRIAIADSPAAAWAWSRYRPEDTDAVLPSGSQRQLLAALPIAALRLEDRVIDDLGRLGLRQIGDLYPLPRADLHKRFGKTLLDRLDRLLGRSPDPITPRRPPPRFAERYRFAEPVSTQAGIAVVMPILLERLCSALAERGMGARRLELSLYGERHEAGMQTATARLSWGSGRPSQDPRHLADLFAEKLARTELTLSAELLVLEAVSAERISHAQAGVLDRPTQNGDDLVALIDRLRARLGDQAVLRLTPRQSHLPERAVSLVDPTETANSDGSVHWPAHWPAHWQRPLCLLPAPEPVTAETEQRRLTAFHWRGRRFTVCLSEGPERIAPEWWQGMDSFTGRRGLTRDYYRIEDDAGRRFWLFTLPQQGADAGWHLHGLMG